MDIWSLGVLITEIVYSHKPYEIKCNKLNIAYSVPGRLKSVAEKQCMSVLICFKPSLVTDIVAGIAGQGWRPLESQVGGLSDDPLLQIADACCVVDHNERPTIQKLWTYFADVFEMDKEKGNFVENLLQRLSQFHEELEQKAIARTEELKEEQRKCDLILSMLLPK